MRWLAVRVVVFAVAYAGTFLALIPSWLAAVGRVNLGWLRWLGLASLAVGGVLIVVCVVGFAVQGQGTPAPFDPPRRLVTGWLYTRVRNPIYAGAVLVLLGEALAWQSLALLGYAAGMWLVWHLLVVAYEEPTLRRRFSASYQQYQAQVPRWLPHLGKRVR
jgi:protein-S-isoprenylcysteine O-methyltransferase Ste14